MGLVNWPAGRYCHRYLGRIATMACGVTPMPAKVRPSLAAFSETTLSLRNIST